MSPIDSHVIGVSALDDAGMHIKAKVNETTNFLIIAAFWIFKFLILDAAEHRHSGKSKHCGYGFYLNMYTAMRDIGRLREISHIG